MYVEVPADNHEVRLRPNAQKFKQQLGYVADWQIGWSIEGRDEDLMMTKAKPGTTHCDVLVDVDLFVVSLNSADMRTEMIFIEYPGAERIKDQCIPRELWNEALVKIVADFEFVGKEDINVVLGKKMLERRGFTCKAADI